jgi:hypothetical protein
MSPTRIAHRESLIRASRSPLDIARHVHAMTKDFEPAAIPVLVRLLNHEHDWKESVESALVRYGEHAADTLRAHIADGSTPLSSRIVAQRTLDSITYRARLLEVGCF